MTHNIDPNSVKKCIGFARKKLNPKTIIAVDLFGQPSDYKNLKQIADEVTILDSC